MQAGEVCLIAIPQFGGVTAKLRPALVLASLPGPYQSVLLCGISTQLQQQQPNWDELIALNDTDYKASGLHSVSIIRLSYLYAADPAQIAGPIGQIDDARLRRLRGRLAQHLLS